MKKYIQKWKKLNKNGIKLSLICGINRLIIFISTSQFYVLSAIFLGMLTYYMPQDIQFFTLKVLELIVVVKVVIGTIQVVLSRRLKKMRLALLIVLMYLPFLAGNSYINKNILTEVMVNRLLSFWIISLVFAALVTFIQPRLFKHYLFKNVINKEYLGIRKTTDALTPQSNLYVDADDKDPDKRMTIINQNVIKEPYQGVVELSFLNREVITAISYKVVQFEKDNKRTFIDDDTIYYPVFTVHPFGNVEGKPDFYHKLKLSRKAAFTATGESTLMKIL
ncbi:hypothetical protein RFF58_09610 [Streptococcus ruminantium]|nr:hypothetical protein [Streptococcus ruminantium]